GQADEPTVMDHLGVEVESSAEVEAATSRLSELGLFIQVENDTSCCYAVQDKVWVHGPGAEPWEVYTVTADAPDATSIHPVGVGPTASGDCECGTPMTTQMTTREPEAGDAPDPCCAPTAAG
ncbi:MAG TPA: hypothetical protein VGH99_05915, partial [Pseudonocardia sp.]